MTEPARTIADRIEEAAGRGFAGRHQELEFLVGAACAPGRPFVLAFVHGPGGIGKSRLVTTALSRVVERGARALLLDGREIEPTPDGFLQALARALGSSEPDPDIARVVALVRAEPRPVALALDTYERLGLLDTWLRQTLMPALPDSVMVILAGRDAPGAAWLASPGWAGLMRDLALSPLDQAESLSMLRQRGLTELQAARVNRFARGHPLALELAAGAVAVEPDLDIEFGPLPHVIGELLDALVGGLPAPLLETLEAASTSRRVTEPILRSLLGRPSVRQEFDDLRRLPFVERTPEGLVIHDVVRETIARELAERDPEAHARYRRRAWSYFEIRARRPVPERLWDITADLIYLIQNPVLRSACFPAGAGRETVERAEPRDGAAIRAIADAHESDEAAALLERWWERQPEAFSVARGPEGVGAVLHLAEFDGIDPALFELDPVARAWRAHMAEVPPPPGDRTLTMRRWLGLETGEMLSPAVGACWLDVKRSYMQLRPRLSRLYSVMADPQALSPIFTPLGFAPIGDPIEIGGTRYQPVWLDFGEGSVDGWLRRLVGEEIDAQEAALPTRGGHAEDAGLTGREMEVLRLLAEGLSNRGIGQRLVISEKTVGRHVSNLFCKLGVHNRAQATRIATERGIAGPL
ncbi:MAG: AAA family ATPase [Thermoleophilia bacterium]|nr:AAA family ATPase [Thermoleophilia bacterium]